jgi:RHS repeat-associated protein
MRTVQGLQLKAAMVRRPLNGRRLVQAALVFLLGALFAGRVNAQSTTCYAYFTNSTPFPTAASSCNNGGAANDSFTNVLDGTTTSIYVIGSLLYGSEFSGYARYQCRNQQTNTASAANCAANPGYCGTHSFSSSYTIYTSVEAAGIYPTSCGYWAQVPTPPLAETCSANCVGDPINPGVGNVYKKEEDEVYAGGTAAIAFERFYNSADSTGSDIGPGWRHSYDRSIVANYQPTTPGAYPGSSATVSSEYSDPATACTSGFAAIQSSVSAWASASASYVNNVCVISTSSGQTWTLPILSAYGAPWVTDPVEYDVIRDDGQTLRYTTQGGVINNPPGISLQLAQTSSGYTLTDDQDNVETYDGGGVLQSITNRSGVVQTVSYDSNGLLSGVTDSFGNALSITRDSVSRIGTLTFNGGGTVQYAYDGYNRLANVTNLDATTRSYLYGNSTFANALTSEDDENGVQVWSWDYDTQERGTSSELTGGALATSLTYNSDGSVTVTDALGAVRTFSYTRVGDVNRPTSISGSQCPACQEEAATTYDVAGWVSSRTDYNGNLTCYASDATRGLELVRVEGFASGSSCPTSLSSYTPASGTRQRKISTTWSSSLRLPTLITEANRTTAFTYDGSGNELTKTITDTTVTPNVSRTWTYTYSSYGQVLTVDGPRTDVSDVTTYTYYSCSTGSQCGHIHTITNAASQVTTYNTYNTYGQPLTITDPNGIVTTLTYDARQRLTSRQVGTETTSFAYYPSGLLETVTLPDGSDLQYTYNNAHLLTQISDGAGNSLHYTLDAMGNRTAQSAYDPSSVLSRTRSNVYNSLSELYQMIGAAGTTAVTTTYGYDSNGNRTSANAPLSRDTSQAFDELNRLKQITDPNSGNTYLAYDAEDDLTSVQDPRSLTTSYTYNGFGNLATQGSPDTGSTTDTYDSGGNLVTSEDARSKTATYSYDALNRLTQVAYGDQTIAYAYDAGTNGKGRLTGASDSAHSMSWQYDGLGRVTGKSQVVAGVTLSVAYAYTSGDLTTLTTPSGQTITYSYSDHQITSISINGSSLLSSVSYEPFGPSRGWTWANSASEVRLHDTDGNPSEITGAESTSYSLDSAFRITGISNSSNSALSWTYGYDSLDRLTSASQTAATYGWTYDANGNRLAQITTNASAFAISTSSNQMTGITGTLTRSYTFDAAGNVLSDGTNTYTYNNRGRLSSAVTTAGTFNYVYNGLGQRIEKHSSSTETLFVYDESGHLLGEYNGSGAMIEETVWMGDLPVATLRPSGSGIGVYYIHADHLNASKSITRPSDNAIVWRWDQDPFGTAAPTQNPSSLGTFVYNLRFPGQYYDSETGLNYNYFRDYDPQVGRYVESDPIGLHGGINSYTYLRGNSIGLIDPFGLYCLSDAAIDAIGGSVGGAVTGGLIAGPAGAAFGAVAGGVGGALAGSLSDSSRGAGQVMGGAIEGGINGLQEGAGGVFVGAVSGSLGGGANGSVSGVGINSISGAASGAVGTAIGVTATGSAVAEAAAGTAEAFAYGGVAGAIGGAITGGIIDILKSHNNCRCGQ